MIKQLHILHDNYYTKIEMFRNNLFIAIVNGIISVSKNPNAFIPIWIDTYYLVDVKSICIYCENNVIVVEERRLIVITRDGGETWHDVPRNIINASGKSHFLLAQPIIYPWLESQTM